MTLKIILVLLALLDTCASFAQSQAIDKTPAERTQSLKAAAVNKPVLQDPVAQNPVTQNSAAKNPVDAAWRRLLVVEDFAFGGVGWAGVISSGETDYLAVMARPNALALMERLYKQGNAQAKSYALVGIKELDPDRFQELAKLEATSDELVKTMRGCIVGQETMRQVVKRIVAGDYSHRKSAVSES